MYSYRNHHIKPQTKFSTILEKISPYSLLISRILIGLVLIFSGFVKAVDPLGFTYKIQDYLTAFGPIWIKLHVLALPLSITLSTLELVIGLNLLFNIKIRLSSKVAFLFMLVMTPLTLYIALFNPVSDCGCFGDALKITNWQTFYKNIVILVLNIILLLSSLKSRPFLIKFYESIVVFVFILSGVGVSIYSLNHLPLIDFRPYKIGVNIQEAMSIPEDAELDKYETTFIYKKGDIEQEFTLENYPKDDSTWIFIDQKTTLVSQGYIAPIHNFSIVNSDLDDITNDILTHNGDVYLFTMYDLNLTSIEGAQATETFYQKHKNSSTLFYVLTASEQSQIAEFKEKFHITLPFCTTDPITIKTIVRANPGLIKIQNATIIGKWHWRDF